MGTTNTLDLNNRVTNLEKAVNGGDSAQANKVDIATEFRATTAYTAGCFVYYGDNLYQFNTDHAAGAWDPTDVVEANVTDQIVSNKAAIDGLTASDIMMSDGVTSVEDALESKSTVLVKDVTFTLSPGSTNSTISRSTGITPNKILSVYLVNSDDVYYLLKTDEIVGFVYAIDENGNLILVAPAGKTWGDVAAQRVLSFRVAYLI